MSRYPYRYIVSSLAVVLTVAAHSEPARAQQTPAVDRNASAAGFNGVIQWQSGTVSMDRKSPAEVANAIAGLAAARSSQRHLVVQFSGPVAPQDRARLKNAGVTLLRYLGDNAFFVSLSPGKLNVDALGRMKSLSNVQAIQRRWKLHPQLTLGNPPSWSIVGGDTTNPDPTVAVYVLFHADVTLQPDGVNTVLRHGGVVRSLMKTINCEVVELPLSKIRALADEDAVQWIEPPLPKMGAVNNSNRVLTQAEQAQEAPYNLDGSGVKVLVYDGGSAYAAHPDFSGRLTVRDSTPTHYHPTHVSGTIGGDGSASSGLYRGMAPGVTIESYGFEQEGGLHMGFLYTDPGDIETDYDEAINVYGADLSNNSIGTNTAYNGFPCEWEGNYGATSALIDAIVGGSLGAPFRIVWANGNERIYERCGTEYHTTAPPACAKNHITVGAVNSNDDTMTSFSSWGPADDGRIKPDIVAPGCQSDDDLGVTSTDDQGGYVTACGTSMAAPTVTGLSALLLQDYRAQFPGLPDPRNSTLKALLAHSAQDKEETGPDYKTGFGSVRIKDTIDHMRTGSFVEAGIDQQGTYYLLFEVLSGDPLLKITMAWDDSPGTPNVSPVLVNDINLVVVSPSSIQHHPWTLSLLNPHLPAVKTIADHVNNIEQVVVDNPEEGMWLVCVHGYNVPEAPQTFSLCSSHWITQDCNGDGIPDDQQLPGNDCSDNGILDSCEPDCDGDGVANSCEIISGADDCNQNTIPDSCEAPSDCNNNGVSDFCDISSGTSQDCNYNWIPDECDSSDPQVDCNQNMIPDECELIDGTGEDFNENTILDECEPNRTIYVDDDGPYDPAPGDHRISDPDEDGTPDHPFDALEEGIDASISGDAIIVRDGLYTGEGGAGNIDLDFGGRHQITMRSENGPTSCILELDARGFLFVNGESPDVRINGFTLLHGFAYTGGGGGILCDNQSSPTIENCIIIDCAAYWGGGIGCYNGSSPIIRNCLITRNRCGEAGGGIYCTSGSAPTISNCTIVSNFGDYGTGGGGIHCEASSPTIINSILWNNTISNPAEIYLVDNSTLNITYSDVEGGSAAVYVESGSTLNWGSGNIAADPLFVDPANDDFHLSSGSICIDVGDPGFAPQAGEIDIDNEPRLSDGDGDEETPGVFATVDMGADEYHDCNDNDIPDYQDIAYGTSPDCNGNFVPDECDIASGTSQDCQPNGIPDECEGGPWYFGDVDDSGEVNLMDLLCMLDALAGSFSCSGVTFEDLDIDPCGSGNGELNLNDLFAMLDALRGLPACPDPCP